MDLGLRGRKALITGASKGIGRATAMALAQEGCELCLVARGEAVLTTLAREIGDRHQVRATAIAGDLRHADFLHMLAGTCGDIDILVNNAGDIPGGPLDKVDETAWRHAWELKVFGYINLTRSVLAAMRQRNAGVIVNVIGTGGERLSHDYIAGSTGNAALMAFTRAVGSQSIEDGVRVLGINPGAVLTDRVVNMFKSIARDRWGDEARFEELLASQREGTMSMPEDVADLVLFLASDRARRISGTIVTIDGGAANYHGLTG